MRVRWTYELRELGEDAPNSSHARLHWDGEAVLVPIGNFKHGRETLVADPSARGYRIDIHRVGADGRGAVENFPASETLISGGWSFVGDGASFELGTFGQIEGPQIVSAAQRLGLSIVTRDASFVSYLPVDTGSNVALLIEDDAEAERTANEMIAAGFAVVQAEAC